MVELPTTPSIFARERVIGAMTILFLSIVLTIFIDSNSFILLFFKINCKLTNNTLLLKVVTLMYSSNSR